jgi:hypothetical protein
VVVPNPTADVDSVEARELAVHDLGETIEELGRKGLRPLHRLRIADELEELHRVGS